MTNQSNSLAPSIKRDNVVAKTLSAFTLRIIGALSSFGATLIVARELSAEQSGLYFLAFSIITILSAVSRGGCDNSVIRFVGSDASQSATVLQRALTITLLLALPISAILFFAADFIARFIFHKPELSTTLQNMSFGVLGLGALTISANALQGLHRTLSSIFVLNVAVNLVIILAVSLSTFVVASQIASLFTATSLLVAVLGCCLVWRLKPKDSTQTLPWRTFLSSSLPLWGVIIMNQAVQWSGQIIAGVYISAEQVALLAIAQRTALLASFVLIAVNIVVAPRFAALHKAGDTVGLESLAKLAVKLTSVLALPILGVMLLFPAPILGLFGAAYSVGAPLLVVLAIGQFINVITGSVGFLLMMSGHERDMRSIAIISGSLAILLALVLTLSYGALGTAVGTAVAIAAQNLLAVHFVKKRLGFNTLAIWRK